MTDQLNQALKIYFQNWQRLVAGCSDQAFFEGLRPVAVGWKVADEAEYAQLYSELRSHCDRIVETWMNGRWIAKLHLKDEQLEGGITIIKLMQRRSGSTDAVGLDHVDFYSLAVKHAEQVLSHEASIKWTHESNDVIDDYNWISVWFADTEAKLKAETVLDVVTRELQQINQDIKDERA